MPAKPRNKKTEVLDQDAVAAAHLADHLGIPLAKWHKLAGIWYTQAKNPKSPHHNAASDRLVLMLQTEHAARRDLIRGGALVRAAQEIGGIQQGAREETLAAIAGYLENKANASQGVLESRGNGLGGNADGHLVQFEREGVDAPDQGTPRRFRRATMAGAVAPAGEAVPVAAEGAG